MDNDSLKLELAAFVITTNLVAFSLGMLLVMIEYQVLQFVLSVEIYHLLPVAVGMALFSIWSYRVVSETWKRLT